MQTTLRVNGWTHDLSIDPETSDVNRNDRQQHDRPDPGPAR
jgi:hypothetical protein